MAFRISIYTAVSVLFLSVLYRSEGGQALPVAIAVSLGFLIISLILESLQYYANKPSDFKHSRGILIRINNRYYMLNDKPTDKAYFKLYRHYFWHGVDFLEDYPYLTLVEKPLPYMYNRAINYTSLFTKTTILNIEKYWNLNN